MKILLALLAAIVPIAATLRLVRDKLQLSADLMGPAAIVTAAAALLGAACQGIELQVNTWTGLVPSSADFAPSGAQLNTFLFAAPLEEAAKVLALWPLYRARRIQHPMQGVALALCSAAGFAAAEIFWNLGWSALPWVGARIVAALPAHFLCAALWGATLGAVTPGGWFSAAWLCAMLTHALSDHFAFDRGLGVLVLVLPLALTQAAMAYGVTRRAMNYQAELDTSFDELDTPFHDDWAEPASIRDVWESLEVQPSRLLLPWIGVGALSTVGCALCFVAASIYLGRQLGLDFSLIDEENVRSNGPLLLLATALALALPFNGYVVARASGCRSVLEPGLGSALAVLGTVLLLSFTTPIAAAVAFALAPVAFVLSSTGAWFGLGR